MNMAALQEDLQFVSQILQEQLRAEIPSGEFFQVKCAVKNEQLMILTQHPEGVTTDTENIFAMLEEALRSLPTQNEQQVEIFLRVAGAKLPYAKHSLTLQVARVNTTSREAGDLENQEHQQAEAFSVSEAGNVFESASLSVHQESDSENQELEEEPFDPMAGVPDLPSVIRLRRRRQIQAIALGVSVVMVTAGSGAAYLLTRPCVMSECQELQTAQQLQNSFRQLISKAKSEQELAKVQQQLLKANTNLEVIPSWSSRSQEAAELAANLAQKSENINKVIKAFDTASLAQKKSQTPANNLEELKARQKLWRQAIAPLETINAKNEFYGLVKPKLPVYRQKLQAVNQQLQVEEKWLQKVAAAQDTANVATQRETTAKSLQELQKVQSTWQIAVNALTPIPKTSSVYSQAQELLTEYKPKLAAARDRTTKQQLAAKTYQQAIKAAEQAKQSETQNQWQAAVIHWKQAESAAKQVSQDSLYYAQAQRLIEPYTKSLKQAEEKLQLANFLQQTRTDLATTCTGEIRVCTFTINEQQIMVRMTPEYEQALNTRLVTAQTQSDPLVVANVTSHLQALQQALEVISNNANLPVIVFDAAGQQIHAHLPQG